MQFLYNKKDSTGGYFEQFEKKCIETELKKMQEHHDYLLALYKPLCDMEFKMMMARVRYDDIMPKKRELEEQIVATANTIIQLQHKLVDIEFNKPKVLLLRLTTQPALQKEV